jgi:hypothetical protein
VGPLAAKGAKTQPTEGATVLLDAHRHLKNATIWRGTLNGLAIHGRLERPLSCTLVVQILVHGPVAMRHEQQGATDDILFYLSHAGRAPEVSRPDLVRFDNTAQPTLQARTAHLVPTTQYRYIIALGCIQANWAHIAEFRSVLPSCRGDTANAV